MKKTRTLSCLAAGAAVLLSASLGLAADANWIGTWKLNVAKSTFVPGPPLQSQTIQFEKTADGIKLVSDIVDAAGKAMHREYTSAFDGKDVPWTGNPNADMASARKIDANTYENTWKKGGQPTITSKATVSADGKTLTIVQSGKDAEGKAVGSTLVFDRQ